MPSLLACALAAPASQLQLPRQPADGPPPLVPPARARSSVFAPPPHPSRAAPLMRTGRVRRRRAPSARRERHSCVIPRRPCGARASAALARRARAAEACSRPLSPIPPYCAPEPGSL
eukprot:scaffold13843_cov124-Isochrysis_galbana.AAC.4